MFLVSAWTAFLEYMAVPETSSWDLFSSPLGLDFLALPLLLDYFFAKEEHFRNFWEWVHGGVKLLRFYMSKLVWLGI